MDYWNHVLWSKETKINLFGSDSVKRVWQQPGEEYKDKCVLPTVKHGGGSVMVWGCMSAAGTRGLHGLKMEARTRPVPEIVWPDPSGTVKFRARTRPEIPPPPTNSQQKKKGKGCISRLHAKKQINQGSAISQTFTSYESLWTSGAAVAYILQSLCILYGQEDNSSTVQIMVIFCQLRLVSILSTLNQT